MLEMSALRVMVKRNREKKQQEETEKQQHVIVIEKTLFIGFPIKGVRNYEKKQSDELDRDGRWRYGSTSQESSTV